LYLLRKNFYMHGKGLQFSDDSFLLLDLLIVFIFSHLCYFLRWKTILHPQNPSLAQIEIIIIMNP
jgi:hypothetical protein